METAQHSDQQPAPAPPSLPFDPSPKAQLILIVDDQPANLKVLRGILADTPYQLTFASSGQQALERVQLTPPDLILLDVMMAGMDGLEVCRRLTQSTAYATIPIIFLTANQELETLTEAFDLGAVDYVTKPFRTPELLARIKTHLQLRHLQQQSQKRSLQEQVLRQIIAAIHSALDVNTLLANTVQQVQRFLAVPRVLIGQYTSPTTLQLLTTSDAAPPATTDMPWNTSPTATPTALNQGPDLTAADAEWLQHWQVQSELRYPLWCRGQLWGCLMLQSPKLEIAGTDWASFLQPIMSQLQIALEQAELLQEQTALLNRLEQANAELSRLANLDSLTQLVNRRYLDIRLEREWLRLQREEQSLSIIMVDVDYFKLYNDTYGHIRGDECLRQIAQVLATVTKRPADLAARYGGEEFVLMLPNTLAAGAVVLAQQVQQAIAQLQIPHSGHRFGNQVTLSLGIATQIPTADSSWLQLLELADKALYQAKLAGRNQYALAPSAPAACDRHPSEGS